jgi:acyl-CoA hydrolase
MVRPYVVTSMKVDEEVWKRAKKRAIDEEITLQQLLNVAVAEYLKRKTLPEYRRKKREN